MFKADSLQDIYNSREISELISTYGHPTAQHFALIKAAGFEHVIHLAPYDVEKLLKKRSCSRFFARRDGERLGV